jgi:PhoH-like ATPase
MSKRKQLVIDTSVLLYDKESIHSFPGNDVILPLIVLDELDRFKEKSGLLGESARYVNRYLDELRAKGSLQEGVLLEKEDQSIRVLIKTPSLPSQDHLDMDRGDNVIIAAALYCQGLDSQQTVKVITKDINLRVKCDALGIEAEDYYRDHIDPKNEFYSGMHTLALDDQTIDDLYGGGQVETAEKLHENTYITCTGSRKKSALGIHQSGRIELLEEASKDIVCEVMPRNKEQRFALDALKRYDVPLVTLTGLAGSGKTFLALMSGIEALSSRKYERIVVTRSIQPVGRDLGYLPGDLREKMEPWMSPLLDNFRHHFKDKVYFEMMIDKGEIEIAPLAYIRGRTFNDSYVIVDEAQNATIHELKTVITRLGENSKIVLMGDTDQIDTAYLDKRSNGLAIVVEKFKSSPLAAHVHLQRGVRSAIATYASKVL